MRRVKVSNLMICGIAIFLFGAIYVVFKEPSIAKPVEKKLVGYRGGLLPAKGDGAEVRVGGDDDNGPLLPFAKHALARRPLEDPTYLRMLTKRQDNVNIDIALGEVNHRELDTNTAIITGLSRYTESDGPGFVASAQTHMPFTRLVIYDLGIKELTLRRLSPLCNVEIREFNFTNYPPHVKVLRNNAWKLIVLTEALEEFGSVFYAHPHLRFRAPINSLFPYVSQTHGFIANMADDHSLLSATHPSMLNYMKLSPETLNRTASNGGPLITGEILLMVMNSTLLREAIPELRRCLELKYCFSPHGAMWRLRGSGGRQHHHHFDLSALSVMMFKLYGDRWAHNTSVKRLVDRLYVVPNDRDPIHELPWSFRCDPPMEEFDPAKMLQKKL